MPAARTVASPVPELTFREAAHFAAVGLGAVEKAVEARVLPAVKSRRRTSGGAGSGACRWPRWPTSPRSGRRASRTWR